MALPWRSAFFSCGEGFLGVRYSWADGRKTVRQISLDEVSCQGQHQVDRQTEIFDGHAVAIAFGVL